MEWIEAAASLGALGICALVLLLVGKAILNKSSDTPALIAVMNRQLDHQSSLLTQSKEQLSEMKALRKDEQTRESRAQDRHERLIAVLDKMLEGAGVSATNVAQLTDEISGLKNVMHDHTSKTPSIEDVLRELQLLREEIQTAMRENREAQSAFNQKAEGFEERLGAVEETAQAIKRITQETPAVAIDNPPTPAQKAVEQVRHEVKESKDKSDEHTNPG